MSNEEKLLKWLELMLEADKLMHEADKLLEEVTEVDPEAVKRFEKNCVDKLVGLLEERWKEK